MKRIGERAVVIGGSMAGLLAARALSDFYGTVTVLERDAFPVSDLPRKGVPQGRHAHGLLARGRSVIEQFFPGWTDEVVASGGIRGDIAGDVHWIGHGVTIKSAPSDLVGLLASRPVLEGHVRRRLLALGNVRAIENCAVQGLLASDDRAAIKGVRVKIGNIEQVIEADLVVDASGRGSSSPVWLESLGYTPPTEEKIEIGIGYTTRTYRRRPGDLNGKFAVVVAGSGPNWRNGVVLYQTEDSWIVSVGGFFGDHAADDELLFAAYTGSLPTSEIYDIVAHAEPLSDFVHYRYPANLRRRYEDLTAFPSGYLVLGDAVCSFNPVYGQGMTVAAQEAVLLQQCLEEGSSAGLARRFFASAKAAIDVPWDIAVGNDLRHPKVQGPRSAKVRFINWYIGKLHMAARDDAELATAFLRVANLEAPPTLLLSPANVLRVIRGNFGRGQKASGAAVGRMSDPSAEAQRAKVEA